MAKTATLLGLTAAGIGLALLLLKSGNALANAFDEAGLNPDTFTASAIQLDALVAAGYPIDSTIYNQAVDYAYNRIKAEADEVGGSVGWSAALGYYVIGLSMEG